jgi:adenylosuccinate lyase
VGNDLLDRLAGDARLPLGEAELAGLLAEPLSFTGAAGDQVAAVVARVEDVVKRYPEAAGYAPGEIL